MVAPILQVLGGLGFMAGRSFMQRRSQERENEAMRAALAPLLAGPSVGDTGGVGQAGPPRPAGIGGANLTDPQVQAMQALAATDPELALRTTLQLGQQNIANQQFQQNLAMQQSNQQLARDRFGLSEDQYQLDLARFVQANNTTQQQQIEAQRLLTDPAYAEQVAAQQGQDSYVIADPERGGYIQVPLRGTDAFTQGSEALASAATGVENITRLRELNSLIADGRVSPDDPIVREYQSRLTQARLDFKNAAELGAITGPDMELIEGVLPDATDPFERVLASGEALDAAYNQLQNVLGSQLEQAAEATRGWRGLAPELQQRAAQAQRSLVRSNARAARGPTPQDRQRSVVEEELGLTTLDDQVAAFMGSRDARERLGIAQELGISGGLIGPQAPSLLRDVFATGRRAAGAIGDIF